MYLYDQSQKITHYGSNLLCLDFIDPPQYYCLFHQSRTKIVHSLEITCKEIVYILDISHGKKYACLSLGCEIITNASISGYHSFGNWPKNAYFINFQCNYYCLLTHFITFSTFY